jgi:hypothetical protein
VVGWGSAALSDLESDRYELPVERLWLWELCRVYQHAIRCPEIPSRPSAALNDMNTRLSGFCFRAAISNPQGASPSYVVVTYSVRICKRVDAIPRLAYGGWSTTTTLVPDHLSTFWKGLSPKPLRPSPNRISSLHTRLLYLTSRHNGSEQIYPANRGSFQSMSSHFRTKGGVAIFARRIRSRCLYPGRGNWPGFPFGFHRLNPNPSLLPSTL